MLTRTQKPVRLRAFVSLPSAARRPLDPGAVAGRLIQITLALYLLPVLVVVMAASGVGMGVLAVARFFSGPIQKPVG